MDRSTGTAADIDTHDIETTVLALSTARTRMAALQARLAAMISETDCAIATWSELLASARTLPAAPATIEGASHGGQTNASPAGSPLPASPGLSADTRTRLLAIAFDATAASPLKGSVVDAVARFLPPLATPALPLAVRPTVSRDELAQCLATAVTQSEQLTLIRGLDAEAAAKLNSLGIARFADIAAFTSDDIAELGLLLGDRRRIAKEGWIEQAALLAIGILPLHARRMRQPAPAPAIWAIEAPADLATPAAVVRDEPATPAAELVPVEPAAATIATPPTDAATRPDPKVIVLAEARRARRRTTHRSSTVGRAATVAAFSLMFAAAWTSIEIADGNWQAISSLVAGSPVAIVATNF